MALVLVVTIVRLVMWIIVKELVCGIPRLIVETQVMAALIVVRAIVMQINILWVKLVVGTIRVVLAVMETLVGQTNIMSLASVKS